NKKLFQRSKKDKSSKVKEKTALEKIDKMHEKQEADLKNLFLEKLQILLKDKASAGVSNNFGEVLIGKQARFTQKNLSSIDFQNVNPLGWTNDEKTNNMINV